MFRRLRHALAHLFSLNRGTIETWWDGDRLMVGFRCAECGKLRHTTPAHVQWAMGMVECRICTHRRAVVMPALAAGCFDPDTGAFRNLECSHCGASACDSIEVEVEA